MYGILGGKMNKKIIAGLVIGSLALAGAGVAACGPKVKTYNISLDNNIEEEAVYDGAGTYKVGDTVVLQAEEIDGYRFMGWMFGTNIVSTRNPYVFKLTENNAGSYIAIYEKLFSIGVGDTQNGLISVNKTSAITDEVVEVQVAASDGYELETLKYVDNDGQETIIENANGYKFAMPDKNVTIVATFIKTSYRITIPANVTVKYQSEVLSNGDTIYPGYILNITANEKYGYYTYVTVAGAGQYGETSFYIVEGNVEIEYHEVEVQNYQSLTTLSFKFNETSRTAAVGANMSNMPTGELVIPSIVLKDGVIYTITSLYGDYDSMGIPFLMCTGLTRVTIPSTVQRITMGAFYGCANLTQVVIEEGVEEIEEAAFSYSGLTSVVLPSTIEKIAQYAFQDCMGLENIELPDGIKSIEDGAFNNCTNLAFEIKDGGKYLGNSDNKYLVLFGIVEDHNVNFAVQEGTKLIYKNAFAGASDLTSVHLSSTVSHIDGNVFAECSGLISFTVAQGNEKYKVENKVLIENEKTIIAYPFGDESEEYSVAEGIEAIVANGLKNDHLKRLSLPSTLVSIGESALPNDLENYYEWAGCKYLGNSQNNFIAMISVNDKTLSTYQINSLTRVIYDAVFENCNNLTTLQLPQNLKSLGARAFKNCNFESIELPEGLVYIGGEGFSDCQNLESLIIPSTVVSVGSGAFSRFLNCVYVKSEALFGLIGDVLEADGGLANNVKNIAVLKSIINNPQNKNDVLFNVGAYDRTENGDYYLYSQRALQCNILDDNYVEVYCNDNEVVFPATVTLGGKAYNVKRITGVSNVVTSVVISEGIKEIAPYSFWECFSLNSLTIPSSMTIISEKAFVDNSNLSEITLESADIYNQLETLSDAGGLVRYATTVNVLASIIDAVDGDSNPVNSSTLLEDSTKYDKSEKTTIGSKEYYVFTKK